MKKTHGNLHPSPLPLAQEKFPAPSNAKCQHKNKLNLTTHGSYLPFFVSLSISYLDYQISWGKYGYYFHGLLYMITSQYQHLKHFSHQYHETLSSPEHILHFPLLILSHYQFSYYFQRYIHCPLHKVFKSPRKYR